MWGQWAHTPISKMRALEFLAKIHITVLCAFPSLFQEALRDAVERTLAGFVVIYLVGVVVTAQTRGQFQPLLQLLLKFKMLPCSHF